MALSHEFDYVRPSSLEEALKLKNKYREKAVFLAGGTDLIVNIKEAMLRPELLIDIKDIPNAKELGSRDDSFFIGAGITFEELIESPIIENQYQMLHDSAKTVASHGVRTRATLAGNICSAVPSLDSAPSLLCYEAKVHCASVDAKREIPIYEWFVSPRKTALRDNEMVLGLSLPSGIGWSGIYVKLGRYGGEDLAQAGWGILLNSNLQYRLSHCALGPVPKRAAKIEKQLSGKELNDKLICAAIELIPEEISPITDIRSSKEYRSHVSGVMLKRGLLAARDRLNGLEVDAAKLLGGIG